MSGIDHTTLERWRADPISTAIASVAYDRDANLVRRVTHRVFQPSPQRPLAFEATIEAYLLNLSRRVAIRRTRYDPYQMQSTAQQAATAGTVGLSGDEVRSAWWHARGFWVSLPGVEATASGGSAAIGGSRAAGSSDAYTGRSPTDAERSRDVEAVF